MSTTTPRGPDAHALTLGPRGAVVAGGAGR